MKMKLVWNNNLDSYEVVQITEWLKSSNFSSTEKQNKTKQNKQKKRLPEVSVIPTASSGLVEFLENIEDKYMNCVWTWIDDWITQKRNVNCEWHLCFVNDIIIARGATRMSRGVSGSSKNPRNYGCFSGPGNVPAYIV